MNQLLFLILFPFLAAVFMLLAPNEKARRGAGYVAAFIILAVSVYLLSTNFGEPTGYFDVRPELVDEAILAGEGLMALYIIYKSITFKKYYPLALILTQSAILVYLEINKPNANLPYNLFLDRLSLIMALIIGITGGLTCIYAFGYMRTFHERHKEVKDRTNVFFFVIFAFLSAMFGLVFSNNILWVYFFWEVTTLCSFVLIGYTKSHEAIHNAFSALTMNLLGSLAFALAILYLSTMENPVFGLDQIIFMNKAIVLLPVVLIGFAGLTKSAQMPFSSWLVGAMVAPTPVSALLHSSTMVKAGVYILVRFSPLYEGTASGEMLSLIGGITFLFASGIAVSQSNSKKVLAYSTIANLGLIVACAGVGTYEAVWAAILLIIFHSLAKCLLFLSVGTVEHRIGSRDIEDMTGLITRMPKNAVMMLIGIAGMFLAPFGMLISKWATMKAFIDSNPVLVGMVAFGSGITVFFWSKWMGKLIAVTRMHKVVEDKINTGEWAVLYTLTGLTISMCLVFPVVSHYYIEPYILEIYGKTAQLGQDNITIMLLMLAVVLLIPFSLLYYGKERKHLSPYMGGRTTTLDAKFAGSMGMQRELSLKNYYLEGIFGEHRVMSVGVPLSVLFIAIMFLFSWLQYAGVFT